MNAHWILEEFRTIQWALLRVCGFFIVSIVLLFTIPIRGSTFAESAIMHIRSDLLPQGASLVARNPLDPFLAEAVIAAEFALMLSAPLAAFEVWRWLAPALYKRERRLLAFFFCASFVLLVAGAVFTYRYVLPAFFSGLYGFLPPGVEPFFDLRAVADLAAGMLFMSSLIFLLPVGMSLLSGIGLVKPGFWLTYARHAILIALIVSAIITPDGTGITMMLLALPTLGLYVLGYLGARFLGRASPRHGRVEEKLNHLISS